ncbi:MAG: amidohydrolase family protein [Ignavibacteria bacterium]
MKTLKYLKLLIIIFQFVFIASVYSQENNYKYCDSHFHLTNYIQEGISLQEYLDMMGDVVERSAVFGIPLQQMWAYENDGDDAPQYYLDSDAPLYYYSFTDAFIAQQYLSLSDDGKKRFDPMITGFNPADMYATAHIKRVLKTYPGVFTGIGEFSIHKEFVSSKVAGEVASLRNPALDSIFRFAGEAGLVVIFHNDIDKPFPKSYTSNYVEQTLDVFRRHPKATLIWAHVGLGRIVRPVGDQVDIVRKMLEDPTLSHVSFDISWDEVAKYIVRNDTTVKAVAELMEKYPDRFLFGTDVVSPSGIDKPLAVYDMYEPLWKVLTPETAEKVKKGNYLRLFDNARIKVREWEAANN